MFYFLLILVVPLIIAIVGFFIPLKKSSFGEHIVSLKEFLILVAVSIFISIISMVCIYNINIYYDEYWNGLVSKKERKKVSCEHSYKCMCFTTCDSKGNCTQYCQTCYEHSHDFSYYVYDTAGHIFTIQRVDRQGVNIPPRWNSVNIGEPTTAVHSYKDYIKSTKGNLFKKDVKYEEFKIPTYPRIYDYYRTERILLLNVSIQNIKEYQNKLSEINGKLGPSKQCNIILVIVKKQNPNYYYALNQKWQGGNKNDIIVIISVGDDNKIEWSNIICLAQSDLFRVKLRDSIQSLNSLDMDLILKEIESNTKLYYQRKRMRDFEYLSASVEPTALQLIISIIINSIICLFLTYVFYNNDDF